MDCHRCQNIVYSGCKYGRCSLPGHQDVHLEIARDGPRRYNKQICPDFKQRRRCSNCAYWLRGEYFADGKTPSRKGRCSLKIKPEDGKCRLWRQGKTSWRKRTRDGSAAHGAQMGSREQVEINPKLD